MNQAHRDTMQALLKGKTPRLISEYTAFAPINIALCKYWGKRDASLNLPINDSLSISLGSKGSHTHIRRLTEAPEDKVYLNGKSLSTSSSFYQRVTTHIDLFRNVFGPQQFEIDTTNTIATAAGLASSASGFAALTKALIGIYELDLTLQEQSIICRLGSGSACRSLSEGFVRWHKGSNTDGSDSYAAPIPTEWSELCIGILNISLASKTVSSREGMLRTKETCQLYNQWPQQAARDIELLEQAIATKDFTLLGSTAEHNAMSMHATMLASWPPLFYWTPETLQQAQKVWQLRKGGISIYFTMDAGPNIKLLFEEKDLASIQKHFKEADIIKPFISDSSL